MHVSQEILPADFSGGELEGLLYSSFHCTQSLIEPRILDQGLEASLLFHQLLELGLGIEELFVVQTERVHAHAVSQDRYNVL